MDKLLLTRQFDIEYRDEVWRALKQFKNGKADFADFLIGEKNRANKCVSTCTFDRALRGEEGFEIL